MTFASCRQRWPGWAWSRFPNSWRSGWKGLTMKSAAPAPTAVISKFAIPSRSETRLTWDRHRQSGCTSTNVKCYNSPTNRVPAPFWRHDAGRTGLVAAAAGIDFSSCWAMAAFWPEPAIPRWPLPPLPARSGRGSGPVHLQALVENKAAASISRASPDARPASGSACRWHPKAANHFQWPTASLDEAAGSLKAAWQDFRTAA